ncbi:uncharacterized protein LOC119366279 [Triticum dicoccoides]|uniref:uncharacterized protein LOC119366279 n=1 Tax=Triticum dicoccoides TaxID=85692 RepID=UPI0018909A53|nr:uncharacterized protein LOC119366279 [Triticum dicoccoides]
MGRIRKVCPKDAPLVSSVESADSSKEPFVPNDFADDNDMSLDCSGDDVELDKALYNFYVNNKVKLLKRKLSYVSRMNVRQKRSSDYPVCATFTRYSGKFFSAVVDGLCSRYKGVIQKYGMGCLLNFVRTGVPLRLVKWLASRFDVPASEFQLKRKFIPLTKYDIHDILDLPVDCEPVVSDPEAGRDFILSHFNLTSIPPVSFFANKLKSAEVDLSDEDVFICFMIVAFSTFLCPNSSLSPSPKYLHIFQDCQSVCAYDLSSFVYEWLLSSIKKFKDATKVASKRSVTFGGCHYAFAVAYLDHLNFGLHSVPDVNPCILAWRGNKVKQFAELDRNNSRSFGKRPLKHLCAPINMQGSVEKSTGSKSSGIGPSDGSFAMKVQRTICPHFGSQSALEVIELVQTRNHDKPNIFIDWAESLVLNVLECVLSSSVPKVSGSEHQSMSKFSFGNKSVSFNSAIANGVFAKSDGIPEVAKSDVVPEVAKSNVVPEAATSDGIPEIAKSDGIPEVVVQQESRPAVTPEVVTPIVPPAVIFGGLHNPVVLSSSSTPAKLRNEAVAKEGPVPVCTLFSEDKAKDSIAAVPPKGISPSKSKCEITDVDFFVLLSDAHAKDCDDKEDVNAFGIPSLAELNRVLGIQPPANVCNDIPVHAHEKSTIEDTNSFRVMSPLLPIRLSQYFHNELGDVQCSQYVADRYLKSFNSPNDEDCIVMVNVAHSDHSKPTNYVNPPTVDLCSRDVITKLPKLF